MALFHEEVLEVTFTRGFYKQILGHPLELDDLLSLDPEFHKHVLLLVDFNCWVIDR